jgi:hypothetical protein
VSDSEFASFDEALKKLELEEEDLKRLISAGEIRAFREGSNMRLRTEDVTKVASQLGIGSEVAEDDAGELLEVEDLPLDGGDEGMMTTQLSEEDTLLDDPVEELEVVEEAPAARAARSGGRPRAAAAAPADAGSETTGIRAGLILTTLVMVLAVPFILGMFSGRTTGLTEGIVGMFASE